MWLIAEIGRNVFVNQGSGCFKGGLISNKVTIMVTARIMKNKSKNFLSEVSEFGQRMVENKFKFLIEVQNR